MTHDGSKRIGSTRVKKRSTKSCPACVEYAHSTRRETVERALDQGDSMDTVDLLKQLEINYKLISNDLEFASHKLETYLAAASRADSSIPDLHALQCRLQALQAVVPGLIADSASVVRERQEEESALNASALENQKIMVGLYARLGVIPDPDWVAVAQEVESLAPASRYLHTAAKNAAYGATNVVPKELPADAPKTTADPEEPCGASRAKDDGRKQASSRQISEEDFMEVPVSTRGRCKLGDVRKVYAKLRQDHEEKVKSGNGSKPKPTSKKMLDAAGLKVFGLTGDSILNTLRALGLITVNRNAVTLASPP